MNWEIINVEIIPFREQYNVLDEEKETVCSFIKSREKAELIAAAPKLLEKLEDLQRKLNQTAHKGICGDHRVAKVTYSQKEIDEVQRLLAKAKGDD